MSDLINMILERRTIRRYKDEMIKDDELEKIIQAGLWAPSAGGRQSPIMLVCKNKEVNEELGCINRKVFGPARSDEVNYVSKTQKSIADDDNIKSAFYNAPVVITLFASDRLAYGINDCSMAAQSMFLEAWSLGVGSCYVARAEETFESEIGKKLMADNGIDISLKAMVCLCFGYPEGDIGSRKPRRKDRVKYAL